MPDEKEALDVVERVRVALGQLTVDLKAGDLQKLIGAKFGAKLNCDHDDLTLDLPFTGRRRGVEMKLVIGNDAAEVDETLLANIIRANQWYQRLKESQSFESIAAEGGHLKTPGSAGHGSGIPRAGYCSGYNQWYPTDGPDVRLGACVTICPPTGKRNVSVSQPSETPASRIAEIACPDEWAVCGNKREQLASAQDQRPPQPTETTQLIGRASGITGFVENTWLCRQCRANRSRVV